MKTHHKGLLALAACAAAVLLSLHFAQDRAAPVAAANQAGSPSKLRPPVTAPASASLSSAEAPTPLAPPPPTAGECPEGIIFYDHNDPVFKALSQDSLNRINNIGWKYSRALSELLASDMKVERVKENLVLYAINQHAEEGARLRERYLAEIRAEFGPDIALAAERCDGNELYNWARTAIGGEFSSFMDGSLRMVRYSLVSSATPDTTSTAQYPVFMYEERYGAVAKTLLHALQHGTDAKTAP